MRAPLILLSMSLACAAGSFAFGGADLTLPLAVSLLAAVGASLLIVTAAARRLRGLARAPSSAPVPSGKPAKSRKVGPNVVIDGSNVMHWDGEVPHLATLREVIATLRKQGYQPGVIFDANAGYKFADRYLDDGHFAKLLNLPGDRVLVVNKGEPADPTILAAARELKAKVITNDRYRDWAGDFPEVATTGHLVKGGFRDGKLWMDDEALAA